MASSIPATEGCCIGGGCKNIPVNECIDLGGASLGRSCEGEEDSECHSLTGACMFIDGCVPQLTERECLSRSDHPAFIRGASCPSNVGGCCDSRGRCELISQTACFAKKGSFYADGCPANGCPVNLGACYSLCADGETSLCTEKTQDQCLLENSQN